MCRVVVVNTFDLRDPLYSEFEKINSDKLKHTDTS